MNYYFDSIILTLAGVSAHISRYDMNKWGDFWRITDKCATKLAKSAGFEVLKLVSYGNPVSCSAQLNGMSTEDLPIKSLLPSHNDYQLVVALILSKPKKKNNGKKTIKK